MSNWVRKKYTPVQYGAPSMGDIHDQAGNISKHIIAANVLSYPGWDVAFPEAPSSHVDMIAYNLEHCYKIQIKSVCMEETPGGYTRVRVPLRNARKYTYTKEGDFKGRSMCYRYFENGIDCVAVFIKASNKVLRSYGLDTKVLWVWKSDVPSDLTVLHIGLNQSTGRRPSRCKANECYGFELTRQRHEKRMEAEHGTSNSNGELSVA